MAAWTSVFLVAVIAVLAYADPRLTFPENVQGRNNRIVSGWEAEEGQIPYQLSLRMVNPTGGVSACGATIIHSEWALTAAHCTATRVTLVIRMGVVNMTRPEGIFETTTYYNHPLYNEAMQSIVQPHDIGLIKFNRVIQFSDKVQPVRLQPSSDKNRNYESVRLQASGWGRTWTGGVSPENMNWVFLNGVSNEFCLIAFGFSSIIVDSTICANGYNITSQSTCQGDSGGPLVISDVDGKHTQVGISSFVSSSGCHTDFPAGFIRPGHYHDWFYQVTGISFDWERQEQPETTAAVPQETTVGGPSETTVAAPSETTVAGSSETTAAGSSETTLAGSSETTVAGSSKTTAAALEKKTDGLPETTVGLPKETTRGLPETTVGLPEETTRGLPETTVAAPEETTDGPEGSTPRPRGRFFFGIKF